MSPVFGDMGYHKSRMSYGLVPVAGAPCLPPLETWDTTISLIHCLSGAPAPSHSGTKKGCKAPIPRLFTKKILHQIVKATPQSTTFDNTEINFGQTKVTSASLLTFYVRRDPERCQSSLPGTTIPGSSIGDISPCVEQLSALSSQSFTN